MYSDVLPFPRLLQVTYSILHNHLQANASVHGTVASTASTGFSCKDTANRADNGLMDVHG